MAYSEVGIVNLALQRIGVGKIDSLDEDSPQAIDANSVWEYIRDEVLEARDWSFARTRVALAQNASSPGYKYEFAYTLPADFLRLGIVKPNDPVVYPEGYQISRSDQTKYYSSFGYVIEALEDTTLCLCTTYDNTATDEDLWIRYVRKEVNPAKYSASFISAFAFRLGADLSIPRTEGLKKYDAMMTMYSKALFQADIVNNSNDYLKSETGNVSWAGAGRVAMDVRGRYEE